AGPCAKLGVAVRGRAMASAATALKVLKFNIIGSIDGIGLERPRSQPGWIAVVPIPPLIGES
ncbi:hypothetical protein, partial [Rhodopseudomonas sp. BR0C11]|uniref:hypothetical protein n=1 Tax=Rhodopseudomonas sp. BR0C11 TaxID=2269370 RepID=UPI001967CB66